MVYIWPCQLSFQYTFMIHAFIILPYVFHIPSPLVYCSANAFVDTNWTLIDTTKLHLFPLASSLSWALSPPWASLFTGLINGLQPHSLQPSDLVPSPHGVLPWFHFYGTAISLISFIYPWALIHDHSPSHAQT